MSIISRDLREGHTDEQKRALAAGLIEAVRTATGEPVTEKTKLVQDVIDRTREAVGSDRAIINVVIHELTPANVSVGGHIHRG
jgi:phenylpyruvate tautomerase PptA (4-oxalocrotonate tautomerase family)